MTHIFIVNPYAGHKNFASALRDKLAEIEGLKYFVFNTRYAGDETDLVKRIQNIFEGDKLRFYCCGGSGTMRNMLNGFKRFNNVEVAFFPCGLTNDFLKIFGENEGRFFDIEELINGDVIKVDYIKTNNGIALNTFSTGLDTNLVQKLGEFNIASHINENLPYMLALLYAIFITKPEEYEIYVDDKKVDGYFTEFFFGNGYMLGGNLCMTEAKPVNDGLGSALFIHKKRGFALLPVMNWLISKNHEKLKTVSTLIQGTKITVKKRDNTPFFTNHDGELVLGGNIWEAEIVKQGLSLVVPKGVTV